jgi:hypothetical protein
MLSNLNNMIQNETKLLNVIHAGFEILATPAMKSCIFWGNMPYSPMKLNRCFRGKYRLYLQGRRISLAPKKTSSNERELSLPLAR